MNLKCMLLGHKYRLYRKINNDVVEVVCDRCKDKFGMCHSQKTILPLDDELRNFHDAVIVEQLAKDK